MIKDEAKFKIQDVLVDKFNSSDEKTILEIQLFNKKHYYCFNERGTKNYILCSKIDSAYKLKKANSIRFIENLED